MNNLNILVVGSLEPDVMLALTRALQSKGHSAHIVVTDKEGAEKLEEGLIRLVDEEVITSFIRKRKISAENLAALPSEIKKLDAGAFLDELCKRPKEPSYRSSGNDYLAGLERARILPRPNNRKQHR